MYDKELDMALESAYDDGYVQALMDMGVDPDEIVEEDVDMFDDNYFDEAMEGNKANKEARERYIATHGGRGAYRRDETDLRGLQRHNLNAANRGYREVSLKTAGAHRNQYRHYGTTYTDDMNRSRENMYNIVDNRLSKYGSKGYIDLHNKEAGDTVSRVVHSMNRRNPEAHYDDGITYKTGSRY